MVVVEGSSKVKPGAPVKAVIAQRPPAPAGNPERAPENTSQASSANAASPADAAQSRNPPADNASASR
jgi:membrane fusion protein (multidrug efflux system)